MSDPSLIRILEILADTYPTLPMREAFRKDPYQLLVAVMLSARSRDTMTIPTAKKLFTLADTPSKMMTIPRKKIEEVLRPIGFYRQKARYVHELSRQILDDFGGNIPDNREDLMHLPGVGRKTANIVLSQYFGKPALAVDTHVHRISNRLGWVSTTTPLETERALSSIVAKRQWHVVNHVFVRHGQETCLPLVPRCSACPIAHYCKRVGVIQSA